MSNWVALVFDDPYKADEARPALLRMEGEVVPMLKSEVALSIASTLSEPGIKVPVPQRHLHITGLDRGESNEHDERPLTKAMKAPR